MHFRNKKINLKKNHDTYKKTHLRKITENEVLFLRMETAKGLGNIATISESTFDL